MVGQVSNCRKCKKLFQRVASDLCQSCIALEEEQFTILYRALQKSGQQGGIAIDELAEQVGVPVEDIERFYLEGRLSTAGTNLKMPCQACGMMMRDIDRKGRYCVKCSEMTANRAGVEVKTMQQIQKADEEEHRRQQQMSLLKKSSLPGAEARKFGSSHRHR